jgi:hypothetical protein
MSERGTALIGARDRPAMRIRHRLSALPMIVGPIRPETGFFRLMIMDLARHV